MEVEGEGGGGAGEGDVGEDGAEGFVFGLFGDGGVFEEGDEVQELFLVPGSEFGGQGGRWVTGGEVFLFLFSEVFDFLFQRSFEGLELFEGVCAVDVGKGEAVKLLLCASYKGIVVCGRLFGGVEVRGNGEEVCESCFSDAIDDSLVCFFDADVMRGGASALSVLMTLKAGALGAGEAECGATGAASYKAFEHIFCRLTFFLSRAMENLVILKLFLNGFKKLGIYDRSMHAV